MARRKKKKQEISLFPFLDILACVIGNLILIITAVVLESVDTDKLADLFQNEAIQKQTEENLATIRGLEERLAKLKQDSLSNDSRVQKAQQQLVEAKRTQREAQGRLLNVPPPPPPPDDEDKADLKNKDLEIKQLIAEIDKIEAKIADKKKKPEQSISILNSNIGGSGVRRPFFVEVTKGGITLLPNDLDFKNLFKNEQPIKISTAKIAKNESFQELLTYVKDHRARSGLLRRRCDTIITFLIRPDAISTYASAKNVVDEFESKYQKDLTVGRLNNGDYFVESLSGKAPLPAKGEILVD